MNIRLLSIAAALACASTATLAENDSASFNSLAAVANQEAGFSASKSLAGLFTDTFTFSFASLPTAAAYAIAAGSHLSIFGTPNVDFTSVTLNGVAGTVINVGSYSYFGFTDAVLASAANSPAFTLEVTGTAAAGAEYGGSLNVAMPVPEPETYALLLAGLGVVGTVARRRRSA